MKKFTEQDHKESAGWFVPVLVIGFLLITAILMSGCTAVENVVTGTIRVTAGALNAIATN